jgi:hypothetical protein
MYVRIDQPRHDPASSHVDYICIRYIHPRANPLDRRDLAVAHEHVVLTVECAGRIDHPSASEHD